MTVADVQAAPHTGTGSRGYSTAEVQGILLLKTVTVEHGLSGDPQRQLEVRDTETVIVSDTVTFQKPSHCIAAFKFLKLLGSMCSVPGCVGNLNLNAPT